MPKYNRHIVMTHKGAIYSYVPTDKEVNACLLDKRRVFNCIGASLDEAVELKIDFNPVVTSTTDSSFVTHQFYGLGNVIEELVPNFKDYEDFLNFLQSTRGDPCDNVPVLRGYITRLYYLNDMPVLNKGDVVGSCNRCCTVLSESDTEKYVDDLIKTGFLMLTSEKPTKIFREESLNGSSLYLNTEFYKSVLV